jgi:Subtilase family
MAWLTFKVREAVGLGATAVLHNPPDPYFVWARCTDWRGFTTLPQFAAHDAPTHVIAELADGLTDAQRETLLLGLSAPGLYGEALVAGGALSAFVTGAVPRNGLHALLLMPGLKRWELGLPLLPSGERSAVEGLAIADTGPVLGVLDDGCAFFNQALCESGSTDTRVRVLWDQNMAVPNAGSVPWKAPANGLFGYGRVLDLPAIHTHLANPTAGLFSGDEGHWYKQCHYLMPPASVDTLQRVWTMTHGTHVIDMAAGRRDPLGLPGAASDAAYAAPIAFVSLPFETVFDASGGSLAVHLLDGLRYIMRSAPNAKLAVNISYGCHAGPHDGSSLLECAMDELLEARKDNFAIVIGAGNGRLAHGHASMVVKPDAPVSLRWQLPADDRSDSFIEVWYPRATGLHITLQAPDGQTSMRVGIDAAAKLEVDGQTVAAVIHCKHVPNGNDAMALIAVGPTLARSASDRVIAMAGIWTLSFSVAADQAPVVVDAWIERDDPSPRAGHRMSSFVTGSTEAGTLNGIATGRHTLVVGGMRQSDGKPVDYSGLAPTAAATGAPIRHHPHRTMPDINVLASCETDEWTRGIRAAAVRSVDTVLMGGTSVASPVLVRRLLNHLATARAPVGRGEWQGVIAALKAGDTNLG